MNKLELINLLEQYPDDTEILIFPRFEGTSEDGQDIETGTGIGVAYNNELYFLGEVQEIEEVDFDEEVEDYDEYDDFDPFETIEDDD